MRLKADDTGVRVAEQARAVTPLSRRVHERVPDQGVSRFVGESFAPLCVDQAFFDS